MDWRKFYHKLEHIIDKSIPYVLILLAGVLIIEFFFKEIAEEHETLISITHNFIVEVFLLDLIFKYIRIKKFKKFLKESWLDILAIFPFYLVFRLVEEIVIVTRIGEDITRFQGLIHVGKDSTLIAEELEKAARIEKIERFSRIRRIVRPILRSPRLIKALHFYREPEK